ncbi:MAG: cell surface protein [Candidatus Hydrogenedentes bacterium]|nr:cell surface protein [Candidatus Hydrogenedentota bacterium]
MPDLERRLGVAKAHDAVVMMNDVLKNAVGKILHAFARFAVVGLALYGALAAHGADGARSPIAIAAAGNSRDLYVAGASARDIVIVCRDDGAITRRLVVQDEVTGLTLSPDSHALYATTATGSVLVLDAASGRIEGATKAGHGPVAPVASADGTRVYVCNRFDNDVSVIDSATRTELARVAVAREPVAAALTPDGRFLFVANLLPGGPADGDYVAGAVSVVDTAACKSAAAIALPNGSTGLRGICVSPDGKFVYATHILAHFQMPAMQLERGWMNTNALSVIDVEKKALVNTVLLDDVTLGAANPWGVACSQDGMYLCVTHAGTHELSIIDRPGLHEKLDKAAAGTRVSEVSATASDVPNDLAFLVGLRRRVKLDGQGPRALAIADNTAFVAEYFSDSVCAVGLPSGGEPGKRSIPLGASGESSDEQRGEMLFNDANLCFQQWQSCASCHPDARVDGLNWDLMNDGMGNAKNTRSMLLSHRTPPVMTLGVRDSAEYAVRAGMKYIQFTERPEADAVAIDAYLKSLVPIASPRLENGELSAVAAKGRAVFDRAGCADCHPHGLYTDQKQYDVGTTQGADRGKPVDTSSLIEVWRTAPYLHDGRAATIGEVLTKSNPGDRHGKTSTLSADELAQLVAFVLSL